MQRSTRIRGLIAWILLLAVASGTIFFHQELSDWWQLRAYDPPREIMQLADTSDITSYARKIFYVAHPAIEEKDSFNSHCNLKTEKTIILGCYDGRYIYIYNVTDQRLTGVKEVTAMHEMLHAAYDRLSDKEQSAINTQLRAQLATLNDARINDLVKQYEKSEPGEVDNELHSILGTEVENLSPTLEKYFSRYFTNRKTVVAFAQRYESVFTSSEQQIAELDIQMESLRKKIEANEADLERRRKELDGEQTRLQQLRTANQINEYNGAIDGYNNQVHTFNSLLGTTKTMVAEYNDFVAKRNQLATAHNNLAQSLNSNLTPIPAR